MTADAKPCEVVYVVNGEEYRYRLHPSELDLPVRMFASLARVDSANLSRPPEDWELRADSGARVPDDRHVGDFAGSGYLFLTLRLGVGGTRQGART